MKLSIFCMMFLLSVTAFADPQTALTITNDIDTNIITISIEEEDNKLTGVLKVEKTAAGALVNEGLYNLQDLYKGSVVQVKSNRDVVKIRMNKNFDPTYGGPFVLDYLFSGISGERRDLDLDLRKNGSNWEVTLNNKTTSKLHVIGNRKIIVGVIGISRILPK